MAITHEGTDIARWLNENGIAAFILKYRLPNDAIMKNKSFGPLQDIQEAMRIIRRNADSWNLHPNRIGVIGFSAGGNLAAAITTHFSDRIYPSDSTSARPDFTILIYPVISMNPEITHADSRTRLLGENPAPETVEYFSNELQVSVSTPPAFIVHASDDVFVFNF